MPVQVTGAHVTVKVAALTPEVLRKLKGLPTEFKFVGNKCVLVPTLEALEYLAKALPEQPWDAAVRGLYDSLLVEEAQRTWEESPQQTFEFKTQPFEKQLQIWDATKDAEYHAYFMEMGTGKTKVTLDLIAYLMHTGKIDVALIIAPNGVHINWIDEELPKHWPEWLPVAATYWETSPRKAQAEKIEEVMTAKRAILSMHVDAFSHEKGRKAARRFLSRKRSLVAVDESSDIKTPGAKRTRAIMTLAGLADYRRILNGTPVDKGPLDLYSQFKFLHPDILGHNTFGSFKAEYAILKELPGKTDRRGNPINIVVGYRDVKRLQEKIAPYTTRVLKSEMLDLPPKLYTKLYVELSPEQKRLYQELKKNMMVEYKGKLIATPMALQRLTRFRQIVGGYIGDERIDGPNPRLDSVLEMLSNTNQPAIIWAVFKSQIRDLKDALGKRAVTYYGEDDNKAREYAKKAFQNGDVDYFVANQESAGRGLTLLRATLVTYYSNGYRLLMRQQSEDRPHRAGQTKNVTVCDVIARGTCDEHVVKALLDKRDIAAEINGDELMSWI